MPRIPKTLRQRIIHVAHNRCEYCLTPQEMTLATFHLDHIIPRLAGGMTRFKNLCLRYPSARIVTSYLSSMGEPLQTV